MSKYTLKEAFMKERQAMRVGDLTGDPRSSMTDKDIDNAVGSIGPSDEKPAPGPMRTTDVDHDLGSKITDDDIDGALKGLGESEFNDAALDEPFHNHMEECGMEDPAVDGLSAPVLSDPGEAGPTELVVIKLGHHEDGMNMGGGDHPSFGAPGGPELEQPIQFESDRWMQLAEIPVINEDAASVFGEASDEPEDDKEDDDEFEDKFDDPDLNESLSEELDSDELFGNSNDGGDDGSKELNPDDFKDKD